MSQKVSGRVWELHLTHTQRLILLAMADHADHEGNNIYPSIGLIAWKTSYSLRQVQRTIKELVDAGLLIVEDEGGGRGTPTMYRFDLAAGTPKPPYAGRDKLSAERRDELLRSLIGRSGAVCASCGGPGDARNGPDGRPWNVYRIVSGAEGGRYTPENVALVCEGCQRRRALDKNKGSKVRSQKGAILSLPRRVGGDKTGTKRVPSATQKGVISREKGAIQMTPDPLTVKEPPLTDQEEGGIDWDLLERLGLGGES